jgi:hypothetical protein
MYTTYPETDGVRVATDQQERGWVRPAGCVGWVDELAACGSSPSLADADYECAHGRLAGDVCPSPRVRLQSEEMVAKYGRHVQSWPHPHPCGCWPQEQSETPDLMGVLTVSKETDMTDEQTQNAPATPVAQRASQVQASSPLLLRQAAEIDAEIERLIKARDYLRGLAA